MSNHIKKSVFLPPISQAEVAQLVEHNLAKVGVASSSLVFRSTKKRRKFCVSFFYHFSSLFIAFHRPRSDHLVFRSFFMQETLIQIQR